MRERFPWGRVAAEGIAIVASILLALAIDAWWDGRRAADAEREFLSDLSAEFSQNRDQLRGVLEQQRRRQSMLEVIVAEAGANRAGLSSDSIQVLARRAYLNPGFYPRTDAMERGSAGAGLELISDPGLRRRVSGFWDSWQHFFRNQARYADLVSDPEVLFQTGALINPYPDVPGIGSRHFWPDALSPEEAAAVKFYTYAGFLSGLVANQGEDMLAAMDSLLVELDTR
jgi:hypothetical protein